jgi:hypothetical protein
MSRMLRPRPRFSIPEIDAAPPMHTLQHLVRTGLEQIRGVKTALMTMWERAEEIEKMMDQANDILASMERGEGSGERRESSAYERRGAREDREEERDRLLQFPALRSPRRTEMGFPGWM